MTDFTPAKTPEMWVSRAVSDHFSMKKNLGMICVKDCYAYGCDGFRFHRCKTNISKNGMFCKKELTPVIEITSKGKHHLSCGNYPSSKLDQWLLNLMDIGAYECDKEDLKEYMLSNGQIICSTSNLFDKEVFFNQCFIDDAFNGIQSAILFIITSNDKEVNILLGRHEFGYFGIIELKIKDEDLKNLKQI